MAIASTLSFIDHGIVEFATPALSAAPTIDWARSYPEAPTERLAAGQRVVIIATAAAASWAVIGAAGLSLARALGAF